MSDIASFPKKVLQVVALFVFNLVFIQAAFAANASLSLSDSTMTSVPRRHLDAEVESQMPIDDFLRPEHNQLQTIIRVDAQKLMKLSLLTAEYKQAYQSARQSLLQAIEMNDELTETLKLQLQIIKKLKAKIHSLEQEILQLKSKNTENIVPMPPLSKQDPRTT